MISENRCQDVIISREKITEFKKKEVEERCVSNFAVIFCYYNVIVKIIDKLRFILIRL